MSITVTTGNWDMLEKQEQRTASHIIRLYANPTHGTYLLHINDNTRESCIWAYSLYYRVFTLLLKTSEFLSY